MTPMSRAGTRQPANAGASMRTSTSTGSPSWPSVAGRKPKSKGNADPSGRGPPSLKRPDSSSSLNLLQLPLGVSIITFQVPSPLFWAGRRDPGYVFEAGRPITVLRVLRGDPHKTHAARQGEAVNLSL